jgi:hypothetical protein
MVAPFDLTTIATMVIGARIGMPAFVFEHLVILFVVGIAVLWGMAPAVIAAQARRCGTRATGSQTGISRGPATRRVTHADQQLWVCSNGLSRQCGSTYCGVLGLRTGLYVNFQKPYYGSWSPTSCRRSRVRMVSVRRFLRLRGRRRPFPASATDATKRRQSRLSRADLAARRACRRLPRASLPAS